MSRDLMTKLRLVSRMGRGLSCRRRRRTYAKCSAAFLIKVVIFAAICAAAALVEPYREAAAAEPGYYALQNGQLSPVYEDVSKAPPTREWEIRLLGGSSCCGKNYWGLITGSSSASVLRQLKESQRFELAASKFFGTPYPDPSSTYTKPFGPIAVYDSPPTVPAEYLERADSLRKKLARLRKFRDLVSMTPVRGNGLTASNDSLRLYSESIKLSATVTGLIADFDYRRLGELSGALDRFSADLIHIGMNASAGVPSSPTRSGSSSHLNVDAADASGYTPLMHAAQSANMDDVTRLVSSGANVNARGNDGDTPLMLAALSSQGFAATIAVIDFLLTHGANINARNSNGFTVLGLVTGDGVPDSPVATYIRSRGGLP